MDDSEYCQPVTVRSFSIAQRTIFSDAFTHSHTRTLGICCCYAVMMASSYDNLPNVESSPSNVSSISNLRDKVADATFLGQRIFLDLFLLMVDKDPRGSVPSVKCMHVLQEASRPNRFVCRGGMLKQNTRGGVIETKLCYSSLPSSAQQGTNYSWGQKLCVSAQND